SFPPKPATKREIARCVRAYCQQLAPEQIEEGGCCVCGQLHRHIDLAPFDIARYPAGILDDTDGISRMERRASEDAIRTLLGPITVPGLTMVCSICDAALSKGNLPVLSLANGLWLGEIPDALKDLTLAERAMIARVRRNRSVVRVSQGHFKMVANVIALPNP
ncbi:hypothetical protein BKA70DRAFT_1045289, partial [Coprinopsis sp. MPI-PUGE-AT-0042]